MKILSIVIALAFVVAGCASTSLPEGADHRHAYFAALADYNQAKRVAAAYARRAPKPQIERILSVVDRTDRAIKNFELIRRTARRRLSNREYEAIADAILAATQELHAFLAARRS